MRRLVALLSVSLLALAACGDDDDGEAASESQDAENAGDPPDSCGVEDAADTPAPEAPEPPEPAGDDPVLDGVTVTGEFGEEVNVEIAEPVSVDNVVRRVLIEGDGEPVTPDSVLMAFGYQANARSGEELGNSFGSLPGPMPLDQPMIPQALIAGVRDVPTGSRVLIAIPGEELFEGADLSEEPRLEEGDSVLMLFDLMSPRAEGTEVEPEAGLPTVTLDDDGVPSIEVPDEDPPGELVSQVLIEGDGPEVTENDTVMAQYMGVCWEDGEVFDTSWVATGGRPASPQAFQLAAGVIPGFSDGLVGNTVGSRVLMVVPPDQGYGSEGSPGIPADTTLVFVVDILDAAEVDPELQQQP